jgi:hypothetical protein
MTYYTCPNCGETALEAVPVSRDYGTKFQPKKYFAKCFHCKWQLPTYYSRTAISGAITWTLPRYFEFNSATGYITAFYPSGNPAEYWTPLSISIPPTINGVAVTGIAANAFDGNTHITSVVIPDSVTSIGAAAFKGCPVTSFTINAGVTIDADADTMGINAGFKTYYDASAISGTYTFDTSWYVAGGTRPAPVAIAGEALDATNFLAQWNAADGAAGYLLDVSTSNAFDTFAKDFFDTEFHDYSVTPGTSCIFGGVTSHTKYYYRVRAWYGDGVDPLAWEYSGYSNTIEITTLEE